MIMHKINEHLLTLAWVKFHIVTTGKFMNVCYHTVKYRLMEFLGSISKAEVSSTNLILNGQSAISPFVITANRMTPNFVPCGIPPLTVLHSDVVSPIFTACCRLVENDVFFNKTVTNSFEIARPIFSAGSASLCRLLHCKVTFTHRDLSGRF